MNFLFLVDRTDRFHVFRPVPVAEQLRYPVRLQKLRDNHRPVVSGTRATAEFIELSNEREHILALHILDKLLRAVICEDLQAAFIGLVSSRLALRRLYVFEV